MADRLIRQAMGETMDRAPTVASNLVVGQIERGGPWVVEGRVETVCLGARCVIVKWNKLYGQRRSLKTQHMTLTW